MRARNISGKDLVVLSAGTTMSWWASRYDTTWVFVHDKHVVMGNPTLGPFNSFEEAVTGVKAHDAKK